MRRSAVAIPLLLILLLAPLAALPAPVSADSSGGIEAGPTSIGLAPSQPLMGGSVTVSLTLYNSNPTSASDVGYEFYKDGISAGKLLEANVVTIAGEDYQTVQTVWNGLSEGEHKVWVKVEYNGDTPIQFYHSFDVDGLPNLEVVQLEIAPASGIRNGDSGNVSALIRNTGTEAAGNSTVQFGIEGAGQANSVDVNVPALSSGAEYWANTSLTFPDSGQQVIVVTPDAYDSVVEVNEGEGSDTLNVEILPDPDYSFTGPLLISSPPDSLTGPWTVSGNVAAVHVGEATTIQIGLSITAPGQQSPAISPIDLLIDAGASSSTPFSTDLLAQNLQSLDSGEYAVTATIDPLGLMVQSDNSNDEITGLMNKRPIPNVVLDQYAHPDTITVDSGDSITWTVHMQNTGDIGVTGVLDYTWEGQSYQTTNINIAAFGSHTQPFTLPTAQGAHTATFTASWNASAGSYDSIEGDSTATGSISVTTDLRLTYLASTGVLTYGDEDGAPANPPLKLGTEYAFTIELASTGVGDAMLNCIDADGIILHSVNVTVENIGDSVLVSCQFITTEPLQFHLNVVAADTNVAQTHSRIWVVSTSGSGVTAEETSFFNFALILGLSGVVLIGVLIAAVLVTRRREEDVERDIYEYCPACDGELEGGEAECPHCSFNMKRARRKFHDCEVCGENIPSMLSHCSFCGTEQDLKMHFETRVKKEKVEVVEEEVEPEVDDDTIVTGTEDFDTAIGEFGYEEGQLESHWDERLAEAEAEMADLEERLAAEEEVVEGDEDLAEGYLQTAEESFADQGIEKVLEGREDIITMQAKEDTGEDLSASDAEIRAKLYELTGDKGVMPGEKVTIGMGMSDRTYVGNELPEEALDFSFDEDEEQDELTPTHMKRKPSRRRKKMGECGACGSAIPMEANECETCGAKFS